MISNFFKHLHMVNKHKYLVFKLSIKAGIPLRGLLHDLSKYSPIEFFEGIKYYDGKISPLKVCKLKNGYSKAWLHHKGRNKHHPEYWIDLSIEEKEYRPIPMPLKYVGEAFCDHLAASKVYNKKEFKPQMVLDYYYNKEQFFLPMHEDTKKAFETLLNLYISKGEKETFKFIKNNYRKKV